MAGYAELHCKTNFSFLRGASHADELIRRAAELEYAALAVTDLHTLSGIVRAHTATRETPMKLIVGAEVSPADGWPVVLWATDRPAYGRLCRLLTTGSRRAPKGECHLTVEDIAEHSTGLIAGIVPSHELMRSTESPADTQPSADSKQPPSSSPPLARYRELFGNDCYLLAEIHRGPDDRTWLRRMRQLSGESSIPLLAAGDVHFHVPRRQALQDVLTAIRLGVPVTDIGEERFPNAQRHLRSLDEIHAGFADLPDAVARTLEVADRCTFSLDELRYEYPVELSPPGVTPIEHLKRLTWEGAKQRYPSRVPDKVIGLLKHELTLIEELGYEAYFLTVWDLVRFARSRGILCQGRGSAANSAVCFCLGITSVDPERADLLFERFVSRERNEAPDIDVDFEHERREEVLQYLYDKYGRDRAGMTAVVITWRTRSAIRDVGKAIGFSADRIDALAKNVEGYSHDAMLPERCRQVGIDPESESGRRLVYLVNELLGFPRHLSQHVGGMVMTRGPLCELAPIENAAMEGRTVVQWDKDDLDELGILKVDCLSLGMLTAIHRCFDLIQNHTGRELTLANIPPEEPQVYDMICRADTMGVFQIESRAQMSMLPRLKPRCFYDLVIEVAIVRPGPIQGQMVHPYLRRRAGEEVPTYPNDEIRRVLEKTLGVPIFQEQAMRLAVVAAGFTPGEADQLRRAMGAWRRPGIIDQFHKKLIHGMTEKGLTAQFAEHVFSQIRGFGEYGFPESHAASFALLVYVSAWLKHYYPAAFAASLINSQPMGFYAPAQLIRDGRAHDVEVRPIDINASDWDCTLEPIVADPSSTAEDRGAFALRLGLRLISGLPRQVAAAIGEAKLEAGPFQSMSDFQRRTRISQAHAARLAEADVFESLSHDRRQALWFSLGQEKKPRKRTPLFDSIEDDDDPPLELPGLTSEEQVYADYRAFGLSLRAHPMSFHRGQLDELRVTPASELERKPNNRQIRVAGIVLLRQRPSTAKGITFVTLEDETGIANLVVRQAVWEQFYQVARRSPAWIAHGKLERHEGVIHVVVNRLDDLSQQLAAGSSSRSTDGR